MIKQEILNRYTGEVIFEAQIECATNAQKSVKIGLAVQAAVSQKINLSEANLSEADLRGAVLRGADLRGAVLRGADLRGANLRWADLRGAVLRGADLRGADLRGADLRGADLSEANLSEANLSEADLRWANLSEADLSEADLSEADLAVLNTENYTAYIQKEHLRVGCQAHSFSDWLAFDDRDILPMDGQRGLDWWRKWRPALEAIRATLPDKEKKND